MVPCSVFSWQVYQFGYWKNVKNLKSGLGIYNNLKHQNVWLSK